MAAVAEKAETGELTTETDVLLATPEADCVYHDGPLTDGGLIISPPLPRTPKKK